jgi:hypothetical protein
VPGLLDGLRGGTEGNNSNGAGQPEIEDAEGDEAEAEANEYVDNEYDESDVSDDECEVEKSGANTPTAGGSRLISSISLRYGRCLTVFKKKSPLSTAVVGPLSLTRPSLTPDQLRASEYGAESGVGSGVESGAAFSDVSQHPPPPPPTQQHSPSQYQQTDGKAPTARCKACGEMISREMEAIEAHMEICGRTALGGGPRGPRQGWGINSTPESYPEASSYALDRWVLGIIALFSYVIIVICFVFLQSNHSNSIVVQHGRAPDHVFLQAWRLQGFRRGAAKSRLGREGGDEDHIPHRTQVGVVLRCNKMRCIALCNVALRSDASRCALLRCITLRFIVLRCIAHGALRRVVLQCVALRCIALHCAVPIT